MIANPDFAQAGAAPGQATGWTLRSVSAQSAIAPFGATRPEPVEGFEGWCAWTRVLATATFVPFGGAVTEETFDAWPSAVYALELVEGLVAAHVLEGLVAESWRGRGAFSWSDIASTPATFGGALCEFFDGWRPGEAYTVLFNEATAARATFHGHPSELFDAWTTKNTSV